MPSRVVVDDDEQIIADLLKRVRRLETRQTTTRPYGTHDEFTVAATPETTFQLTYIPVDGTCAMYVNGLEQEEDTDYTVDYDTTSGTVGLVTFVTGLTTGDQINFRYLVTDWLVARSLPEDDGLEQTTFDFLDIGDASHGTSNYQTFTVPDGVTELTVEAWGAEGGGLSTTITTGFCGHAGKGGYIKGTISVTPGEVLRVYVGGCPGANLGGGFNGGGDGGDWSTDGRGGGGATDIRRSPYALADRLIIAGGGGGAGGYSISGAGTSNTTGGDGGYTSGTRGLFPLFGDPDPGSGRGGTSSAGGAAGTGDGGTAGSAGASGVGGDAANGGGGVGGGGGGGGYYGGGSGESNVASTSPSGGGGSSAIPGGTHVADTTGAREGDGLLVVSYPF